MMYRFVSLIWDKSNPYAKRVASAISTELKSQSPHKWEKAYNSEDMYIFHSGAQIGRMQTYMLANNSGAILGRLFHRDSEGIYPSQREDLDSNETKKCLQSCGQHLVDNYWGRYITFINDLSKNIKYIMRDPCGDFPCFITAYKGVEIYFSDIEDIARFGFLDFSVNWNYIRSHIMLPFFQKIETGLNEVTEILPAQCLEIRPNETIKRFTWNPEKISQYNIIEEPKEASRLLRETTQNCVSAWARCYNHILHRIGGLDSSIVLACLSNTPDKPEITCETHYTKSRRGDERFFTRQMAKQANTSLIEYELNYKNVKFERIFHTTKTVKPYLYFFCIDRGRFEINLAKEKGAEILFTGVGGDQLFYYFSKPYGAFDYVNYHGFDHKFPKIIMEASRYSKKSVANVASNIIKHRYFNHKYRNQCFQEIYDQTLGIKNLPFFNIDAYDISFLEKSLHPLLLPQKGIPIGKSHHIMESTLLSLEYYDPSDQEELLGIVNPLLSQPLIELCLRIPIWVLTHGGIDRGLARKAFQDDLPKDILRRRGKSSPDPYYIDTYNANIDFFKEILLQGKLVENDIIIHQEISKSLDRNNIIVPNNHYSIMAYTSIEAWIKKWTDRKITNLKSA